MACNDNRTRKRGIDNANYFLDICKNWFKDYVYDNKNGKCLK